MIKLRKNAFSEQGRYLRRKKTPANERANANAYSDAYVQNLNQADPRVKYFANKHLSYTP